MKKIKHIILLFILVQLLTFRVGYSSDGSNHAKQSTSYYITSLLSYGCSLTMAIPPLKKFCSASAIITFGAGTVHAVDAINDSNLKKVAPGDEHKIQSLKKAEKL